MIPDSQKGDITVHGSAERCHKVMHCAGPTCRQREHELIEEEPLLIRVEGRPSWVVMRTSTKEDAGAALNRMLALAPDAGTPKHGKQAQETPMAAV